jgi:hypothetical protein
MSDTVRFLSVASPAVSASEQGFPFGIANFISTPPDNTYGPVPLGDAIKFYWKPKNWALSIGATVDTPGGTFTAASGTMIPAGSNPTRELDFILNPVIIFGGSDGNGSASFGVAKYSGDYYLVCGYSLVIGDGVNALSVQTGGYQFTDNQSTFTGTFEGHSITLYVSTQGTIFSHSATSLALTIIEYWPYAALKDGSPIYDTATGAELQPPTN